MWVEQQIDSGNAVFRATGGDSETSEAIYHFDTPTASGPIVDAAFGRGTVGGANSAATYIRLKRPDGSDAYVYVATGATAITVSNTKP